MSEITGYIYKIVSLDDDKKVYIGSTTKKVNDRLRGHERNYKSYRKGNYNYVTSFDVLETGNYRIEKIKKVKVESIQELRQCERHYIEIIECVNKNVAGRSKQESHKQYRERNKDKIKEYHEKNKQKINEYIKQYREKNKEKIKEQKNEKHVCECGGRYTQQNRSIHCKTKKHLQYVESLNNN